MSALAGGILIASGLCACIPVACAIPHRHRAPIEVRLFMWIIFVAGLAFAMLGIGLLLEVSA